MPELHVRWSAPEARKPYARPFGVSFLAASGESIGGVAVSGADLLYYRQFQAAVLALTGEVFALRAVEQHPDQQRAWLDVLASLLPSAEQLMITPRSTFDHERGRMFS